MGRKFIDCRETPSVMNCSIAISADSEEELIDAAVQHAVSVHGHKDTPDFRTLIKEQSERERRRSRRRRGPLEEARIATGFVTNSVS